jgi:hypothetical protein
MSFGEIWEELKIRRRERIILQGGTGFDSDLQYYFNSLSMYELMEELAAIDYISHYDRQRA